jgi:hypothetical protein
MSLFRGDSAAAAAAAVGLRRREGPLLLLLLARAVAMEAWERVSLPGSKDRCCCCAPLTCAQQRVRPKRERSERVCAELGLSPW